VGVARKLRVASRKYHKTEVCFVFPYILLIDNRSPVALMEGKTNVSLCLAAREAVTKQEPSFCAYYPVVGVGRPDCRLYACGTCSTLIGLSSINLEQPPSIADLQVKKISLGP
jgi:hypothetical protein